MAGITAPKDTDVIQERLRQTADKAALDAIVRYSTLRGQEAARAARHAVASAKPILRAEFAQKAGGITRQQATIAGLGAVGVLALDVAALTVMAVRGPRWVRVLAGGTAVLHVGLVAGSRLLGARIRAGAREQLAAGKPAAS